MAAASARRVPSPPPTIPLGLPHQHAELVAEQAYPRTSLLGLPREIRHTILRFLLSMDDTRNVEASKVEARPSYFDAVIDNVLDRDHADDTRQNLWALLPRWDTTVPGRPFSEWDPTADHREVYFRYFVSYQVDATMLQTCPTLRDEGRHVLYRENKFILVQGHVEYLMHYLFVSGVKPFRRFDLSSKPVEANILLNFSVSGPGPTLSFLISTLDLLLLVRALQMWFAAQSRLISNPSGRPRLVIQVHALGRIRLGLGPVIWACDVGTVLEDFALPWIAPYAPELRASGAVLTNS